MYSFAILRKARLVVALISILISLPMTAFGRPSGGSEVDADHLSAPDAGVARGSARVLPSTASLGGKTYGEWVASFWQWALALPVDGHPFSECMRNFSAGQSGNVWYWSAPDGPVTCKEKIPAGKAILLTMRDVEASSLEEPPFYGATEAEQRRAAQWFADHIIDVFCLIDGVPVQKIANFRFVTRQFVFSAPTPWIFGAVGGSGTALADGYYVLVPPLPKGKHMIHYGGAFRFVAGELGPDPLEFRKDVVLELTVE